MEGIPVGTPGRERERQLHWRLVELIGENQLLRGGINASVSISAQGDLSVRQKDPDFAAWMAFNMAETFREGGATNFLEWELKVPELGPMTMTMQRREGKTPAQLLDELRAERDALRARVQDLEDCIGNALA